MKSKILSSVFFILVVSCSQPELALDNQFDPDNPDFVAPETNIDAIPPVINMNSVQISWTGNDPDMEFQHKLDNNEWSDWDEITTAIFSYLDEGNHRLLVRGRYLSGTEEASPDTLDFEVDAIEGSSLRIENLYSNVANSDTFSVHLIAEEVEPIAGAGIIIKFTESGLSLDSIAIGEFFQKDGNDPIAFDTVTVSSGNTILNLDIANFGGTVEGTGIIATLYLKAKSTGEHRININNDTKLKDADNNDVDTEKLEYGLVNVY